MNALELDTIIKLPPVCFFPWNTRGYRVVAVDNVLPLACGDDWEANGC